LCCPACGGMASALVPLGTRRFVPVSWGAHLAAQIAAGALVRRTGPSGGGRPVPTRPVSRSYALRDPLAMTKRVAAAFLWFYTGWYAGGVPRRDLRRQPRHRPDPAGPPRPASWSETRSGSSGRRPAPQASPRSATVETAPELA
jgi:hypothetical protein